jgi:hypothetical protein
MVGSSMFISSYSFIWVESETSVLHLGFCSSSMVFLYYLYDKPLSLNIGLLKKLILRPLVYPIVEQLSSSDFSVLSIWFCMLYLEAIEFANEIAFKLSLRGPFLNYLSFWICFTIGTLYYYFIKFIWFAISRDPC